MTSTVALVAVVTLLCMGLTVIMATPFLHMAIRSDRSMRRDGAGEPFESDFDSGLRGVVIGIAAGFAIWAGIWFLVALLRYLLPSG